MSLISSIMFLFIGAFITALAFWKDFKQDKKLTTFKWVLIISFLAFIIVGIWDTINRMSDSDTTTKTVTTAIDTSGKSVRSKIDTSTHLITHNSDSNTNRILKSIPHPVKTYYKVFIAKAGQRVFVVPFNSSDPTKYRALVNGMEFDNFTVKNGKITVGFTDAQKGDRIKIFWYK